MAGSPAGHPRWGANPAFLTLSFTPWSKQAEFERPSRKTENSRTCRVSEVGKVGLPPLFIFKEISIVSFATSRHQHNLSDIFSRLQVAVRIARLRERERFVDKRTDPAFTNSVQDHLHPRRNFLRFVPHVAEV